MFNGISQHSKKSEYIIYSVYQKNLAEEENFANHCNHIVDCVSKNIYGKALEGVYKGEKEQSIIRPFKTVKESLRLGNDYGQESVLLLKNHKHGLYKAYLLFMDSEDLENIGYFRQVPKDIAQKQDSYTRDGDNYYICTESDATTVEELTKLGLK